jgi:hypothetical protein
MMSMNKKERKKERKKEGIYNLEMGRNNEDSNICQKKKIKIQTNI